MRSPRQGRKLPLLGQLGKEEESNDMGTKNQGLVALGTGLAALLRQLVKKIKVNEYIDFPQQRVEANYRLRC